MSAAAPLSPGRQSTARTAMFKPSDAWARTRPDRARRTASAPCRPQPVVQREHVAAARHSSTVEFSELSAGLVERPQPRGLVAGAEVCEAIQADER